MFGHLVLDLRTAVPLHNKHDEAPVRNYRLIGSGTGKATTMDLSLALEEVDVITHDLSEDEPDTVMSNIKQVNQTNRLSPVLVESGVNGGYFLIGPQSHCNQKFSLSICLVTAENLPLLLPKGLLLNPQDPFYFQYDMLGVDISTEQFTNLEKPEFVSEKATAMICSTQEYLSKSLSSATVTLKLCCGSVVLAAAVIYFN